MDILKKSWRVVGAILDSKVEATSESETCRGFLQRQPFDVARRPPARGDSRKAEPCAEVSGFTFVKGQTRKSAVGQE